MRNCSFIYQLPAALLKLLFCILFILPAGCEPKKLSNTKEIADEVERRVVKRITRAMVLQETRRVGDSITRIADKQMLTYLQATLDSGNFKAALEYRHVNKYDSVNNITQKYLATIGRSSKTRAMPATDPVNLLLQEQLKKYEALNQQKKLLQPEVVRVGQNDLLYTKPIVMSDARCLQCHSESGKLLLPENQKMLPANFKNKHVGYQKGDWAGMWYVRFKTKGILDSITQKRRKPRRP